MGAVKRDYEELVSEKAEEFAQQRYTISFDDLSNGLKMRVWTDAEQAVAEKLQTQAEMSQEAKLDYVEQMEFMRREGN